MNFSGLLAFVLFAGAVSWGVCTIKAKENALSRPAMSMDEIISTAKSLGREDTSSKDFTPGTCLSNKKSFLQLEDGEADKVEEWDKKALYRVEAVGESSYRLRIAADRESGIDGKLIDDSFTLKQTFKAIWNNTPVKSNYKPYVNMMLFQVNCPERFKKIPIAGLNPYSK